MARKLIFTKDNEGDLNVIYDAITKHDDSGGVAGLRKISKILDLIDDIATLDEKTDQYVLKTMGNDKGESFLFLDEEQYNYIKACFDKVKWHPMRARKITHAFTFLESISEAEIKAVKSSDDKDKTNK